ncbi:MAG TPA: hypothetical protein VL326_21690 [Kofleriaceae bacterium]|jgi:hypothetical protein|nr:hypothetical protein [Kofleriaceae bacterium]
MASAKSADARTTTKMRRIAKPAGYSGTPLPQKLGIKEDHEVVVLNAPRGFFEALGKLPPSVTMQTRLAGKIPFDVIVAFVQQAAQLVKVLKDARPRMQPAAGLWIAWPKKSSGVPTDITEDVIRQIALPTGVVDNKVCAIDETWSGLRLVIRKENR